MPHLGRDRKILFCRERAELRFSPRGCRTDAHVADAPTPRPHPRSRHHPTRRRGAARPAAWPAVWAATRPSGATRPAVGVPRGPTAGCDAARRRGVTVRTVGRRRECDAAAIGAPPGPPAVGSVTRPPSVRRLARSAAQRRGPARASPAARSARPGASFTAWPAGCPARSAAASALPLGLRRHRAGRASRPAGLAPVSRAAARVPFGQLGAVRALPVGCQPHPASAGRARLLPPGCQPHRPRRLVGSGWRPARPVVPLGLPWRVRCRLPGPQGRQASRTASPPGRNVRPGEPCRLTGRAD